jgi:hypothetical protein
MYKVGVGPHHYVYSPFYRSHSTPDHQGQDEQQLVGFDCIAFALSKHDALHCCSSGEWTIVGTIGLKHNNPMSRTAGSAFGSTARAYVIAALPAVGYLERST